ncbi:MAG: hypothetical protein CEE42_02650 [Promethearchaeota archaeon Loki_b31]|nr:MAG: hypothetical protein CEE42_02650 [Candidatus Lokiarchaeota archaeon Loki_b31]
MLYFLFLYQIESGELLYEKEFQVDIDSHMDLFGSFFSALKLFVSEMVNEGIEELKTIGLGDLMASIIRILEANIDLVIIAEKDDKKEIQKLSSKLKNIVLNYKELFLVDAVKSEDFENFDKEINDIILSHRKILDPNALIEKQKDFLKSIWDQRGKISDQLRDERKDLENERTIIINNLLKENNVLKKFSLCKLILELSDKLEDEEFFLEYQKKAKIIANEINDQKIRLKYYLNRAKESLKVALDTFGERTLIEGDFKEVYSNLYSFSSKLKNFASVEVYEKYYHLVSKLINRKGISTEEFSLVINEISNMDENIESYFHIGV